MTDYEKELREAWERWEDDPDAECKRCTPKKYFLSNNCANCGKDKAEK